MVNAELIKLVKIQNKTKQILYDKNGNDLQDIILTKILGNDYQYTYNFYPYFEVVQVDKNRPFILKAYEGSEWVQYIDQTDIFLL